MPVFKLKKSQQNFWMLVCTDPAVTELLRCEDDGSTLFPRDSTESQEEEKGERGTNDQEENWGATLKTHICWCF